MVAPAALIVAGCGGRVSASHISGAATSLAIHAETTRIDTNGSIRFTATLPDGNQAKVDWSVSGGDASAGAGRITAQGVYTPPAYVTEDAVKVSVNAVLSAAANDFGSSSGTADLTVTPGFLQPLTPENLSVGPGGSVTISGSMTEVGGSGEIRFALASGSGATPREEITDGSAGSLGSTRCVRGSVKGSNPAYTSCTVTYTAPTFVSSPATYFVVGAIAGSKASSSTLSWGRILLNANGIVSSPTAHQAHLPVPVALGSSSSNNSDYDAKQGQLADCCGGTLGALLQDAIGNQYVLSNNHVLARSDQSIPGESVIQPGLIDNGCTPYGVGPGTTQVATLTGYPPLNSPFANIDAAIARVTAGSVDPKGDILELGAKQLDGTLGSAPPGISSTAGRGESATLGMTVAKSGRTTGLTCAAVSAINVDVKVDYFTDCAETLPALTKTFTNQIALAGTNFTDAGDSGALVVDSSNAEPIGLFFAGGVDANGVEHSIANPVSDVLSELNSQVPGTNGSTNYSFVGAADHPVSCLDYGSTSGKGNAQTPIAGQTESPADIASLADAERERVQAAIPMAEPFLSPATGVMHVEVAVSKDHPGQGALLFTVEPSANLSNLLSSNLPSSIGGVTTMMTASNPANAEATEQPKPASMSQALAAKNRNAATLLEKNPAIFGVGVGQSLDNPRDAAVVLFVDRKKFSGTLPELLDGQRVRIVLMDRLHVTRAHHTPLQRRSSCSAVQEPGSPVEPNLVSRPAQKGSILP